MIDLVEKESKMIDDDLKVNHDRVSRVVENAISNFSDIQESYDLKNITKTYEPLVVDKILEKSSEVLLVDTTNELVQNYSDKIAHYSDTKVKVTVYSSNTKNPFEEQPKIEFHHLTSENVKDLSEKNIKNIIIGDRVRFMWEKFDEKPTYNRFVNALKHLFYKNFTAVAEDPVIYQSLTNFHDESKAHSLLKAINQVIANPH